MPPSWGFLSGLCVLATALLIVVTGSATATIYTNPNPPPSFNIAYNSATKSNHLQANLTYMSGQNLLYTYVFSFTPWTETSSLFAPENCTNRRWQDFNANNPILWNNLWSRLDLVDPTSRMLNTTAISGSYLSWPTPALPWTVAIASVSSSAGGGIVSYDGDFTIEQLVNCAGDHLTVEVEDDYFVYQGTFYIVWVQPISPYLPGLPFTGEYSTRAYPFPFEVWVNRHVDTEDGEVHTPSVVYSYILLLQWEPYLVSTTNNFYQFHLLLETTTPASVQSDMVAVNYNRLSPLSTSLYGQVTSGLGNLILYLNETESTTTCAINSQFFCKQTWSYYSAPISTNNFSVNYNDTYSFNARIDSCPVVTGGTPTCSEENATPNPSLITSIPISFAIFLDATVHVNVVDQFTSNITYYTSTNFTTVKQGTNYFSGEQVIFKHRAYLYPLNPNFYSLYMENVYACAPVVGGHAPYLGYDSLLGVQRHGCRSEEYINGVLNIPATAIFIIAVNESTPIGAAIGYGFQYFKLSSMLKSEVGGEFSLDNLWNGPDQVGQFYLHVESSLFLPTRSGGSSSNEFHLFGADADKSLYTFGLVEKLSLLPGGGENQNENISPVSSTLSIIGYSAAGVAGLGVLSGAVVVVWKKYWRKNIGARNVRSVSVLQVTTDETTKWHAISRSDPQN